jgi:hypothetical protein
MMAVVAWRIFVPGDLGTVHGLERSAVRGRFCNSLIAGAEKLAALLRAAMAAR